MPSKAPKVEAVSQDHWDKYPPPVDQELWKQYMNESDSDSDESDTEEGDPMAGPSSTPKTTKGDASAIKPVSKINLIKEVLDDSFNTIIYNILDGVSVDETPVQTQIETMAAPERAKETPQAKEASAEKGPASSSSTDYPSKPISSKPVDPKAPSPLETCKNCNLPRLKYPRIGITAQPPPDPSATYCANEPPVVLSGHDVHGNAFPGFKPKPNTTTSTTSAAATSSKSATKPKPNTSNTKSTDKKPSSTTTTTTATATAEGASPSTSQDSPSSEHTPTTSFEYPQIRTPQMKCPNAACGQWKAVNVMAKHLDACLLGKGRRAGREARERIGGTGTPGEAGSSRAGTPRLGVGSAGNGTVAAAAGAGAGGALKRGRGDDDLAARLGGGGKKQKKGK